MKNIVIIAGTNSKKSINRSLVHYVASLLPSEYNITEIDLSTQILPLYGVDTEGAEGVPEAAKDISKTLQKADGVILSLAEHNGAYTAAFKNMIDWASRVEKMVWQHAPMLLMSTSGGPRGAQSVFELGQLNLPRYGANIVAAFKLPSYDENFRDGAIIHTELNEELKSAVETFQGKL